FVAVDLGRNQPADAAPLRAIISQGIEDRPRLAQRFAGAGALLGVGHVLGQHQECNGDAWIARPQRALQRVDRGSPQLTRLLAAGSTPAGPSRAAVPGSLGWDECSGK